MEKIQLSKESFLLYIPDYLKIQNLNNYFQLLLSKSIWRDDKITMFGKTMNQPRKVAFYGDDKVGYTYSKISMRTQGWSRETKRFAAKINDEFKIKFNTCLLNYYRNGDDYMSWHCDNEPELGLSPLVASISIGQERDFLFREKYNHNNKFKMILESGSLLLMMGKTQIEFQHALPKRKTQFGERISLTFRNVLSE